MGQAITRVTLPLVEGPRTAARAPCADEHGALPLDCPGWCPYAVPRCAAERAAPSDARHVARVGDSVAGRWLLRKSIGRGAMGEVFLADDLATGGAAAIKLLHPDVVDEDALDAFALEGRTLARLVTRVASGMVVALLDRGVHRGVPFLAMEHVAGTTLAAVIAASPSIRLPVARALGLLRALAAGLDAVHGAGILHGDIKPTNILLGHGRVVLADFGLAHPYGPSCRTRSGSVRGTPLYLAPELACGLAVTPDRASDVYAFATVAYELLAGRPPLAADSIAQVIARQLNDPPEPISQFRPELRAADRVFARAFAKRRGDRHRSAGELVRALRLALGPR